MSDGAPPRSAAVIALEKLVNQACDEHTPEAVVWAWTNLFRAFLPLATAMLHEQTMFELAKKNGMGPQDVEQAIVLLASLRAPPDDHAAWVAAGYIVKNSTDVSRLLGAVASVIQENG